MDAQPLTFHPMTTRFTLAGLLASLLAGPLAGGVCAAQYPAPRQADFILKNFHFTSGDTMPELRMHYRALGKPVRDAHGVVRNAVLIMRVAGFPAARLSRRRR